MPPEPPVSADPAALTPFGRFARGFGAIAGSLPWLGSWWAYKLGVVVWSEAGVVRTLGLFETLLALWLAVAAVLACAHLALPRLPARALAALLFGFATLNATLTGLSVFYLTPRFAPTPVLGVVAIMAAVLVVRFVRYDAATQAFIGRTLVGAGLAVEAAMLLAAPWVLAEALADRPHLPLSPLPPVGAAVRGDAPKRIILVSFDALRSRSTSLMTPTLDTTPALAALATEATTFTNARSASDNTLVSLPTVLSGVRPNDYFPSVGNNAIYLREGFLTGLGGFLAPAGYHAYYATMLVNPLTFGLDGEFTRGHMTTGMFRRNQFNTRSFVPLGAMVDWTREKLAGHWDDEADLHLDEVPATREAFDEGLGYLKGEKGKAFLWVHIAVPHTPYHDVPAAEAAAPGPLARYEYVTERQVVGADPKLLQHYERVYEDYVRFGDAELGRFLANLKAAGLYEDTLLVVTSDHGEDFRLPGHLPHGNGIATEDVSHVPLVIRLPGQHTPRREDALVGHRDLVPTLLARVYQRPPDGLVGLPLLEGPVPKDRYLYTWAMTTFFVPQLKQAETIAAFHGPWKYLVRYPTREESLYDLRVDPQAETNLAARLPEVLQDMRQHLRDELHP